MDYSTALGTMYDIGTALSNSAVLSAHSVLVNTGSTTLQKQAAYQSMVIEHNNSIIETAYAQDSYDALVVIHDTVNPNGPLPDRPM